METAASLLRLRNAMREIRGSAETRQCPAKIAEPMAGTASVKITTLAGKCDPMHRTVRLISRDARHNEATLHRAATTMPGIASRRPPVTVDLAGRYNQERRTVPLINRGGRHNKATLRREATTTPGIGSRRPATMAEVGRCKGSRAAMTISFGQTMFGQTVAGATGISSRPRPETIRLGLATLQETIRGAATTTIRAATPTGETTPGRSSICGSQW